MDLTNQVILIGSALVLASILIGLMSARLGAPLLFVFLGLGMLAGEDGPGGILFEDYQAAYLMGSIALAVILFNGGLRTSREVFAIAFRPALALASAGVLITAGLTALAAMLLLGLDFPEGFLLGAIVGSTDAAAVFMLLGGHGLRLPKKVLATLEAESGLNDPMAIFLTLVAIALVHPAPGQPNDVFGWALMLLVQLLGGAAIGWGSGKALTWAVNRLDLAAGLYPIFVLSWAMLTFAAAQVGGASGFLAVYLTAMIFGNSRHQAAQVIDRFHDGLSWLCQIGMFLMLGLLVTPSHLLATLLPATGIALALMFLARPVAIALCLTPFGFTARQQAFVSWVGLRGAVPIFLGSIPVLAGVPNANLYFSVAFVVVLLSLLVQGWTIAPVARMLKVEEDTAPVQEDEEDQAIPVDLPGDAGQDMVCYDVSKGSRAEGATIGMLGLPHAVSVAAVIRDGRALAPDRCGILELDDMVMVIAPQAMQQDLRAGFAPRRKGPRTSAESQPFLVRLQAVLTVPARVILRKTPRNTGEETEKTGLALAPIARSFAMPAFVLALASGAIWLLVETWPQDTDIEVPQTALLQPLFDEKGLDLAAARQGKPIPPLFLESLPADWPGDLALEQRKELFFEILLPLVLDENRAILQDRQTVEAIQARRERGEGLTLRQQASLDLLARRYEVDYDDVDELLMRVAPVPVSLALAQAALGSGWGQSRLAREENSLFGLTPDLAPTAEKDVRGQIQLDAGLGAAQLTADGSGEGSLTPGNSSKTEIAGKSRNSGVPRQNEAEEARDALTYDSLKAGVRSYMRYLNTHSAFSGFRKMRNQFKTEPDTLGLASTLNRYARDGRYTDNLTLTIKANDLTPLDRMPPGTPSSR